MPSTSIYLPDELLEALDRLAEVQRVPRNRIIVAALREIVERGSRRWPEGYFAGEHLDRRDLEVIRAAQQEFDDRVYAGRRSRPRGPF